MTDAYHGLLWQASGGLVENVTIFGIPGTAAIFARTAQGPTDKWGGLRPFDNEKLKLWNIDIGRVNRGIDVQVVDAVVGNLSGSCFGEYGLRLSGGATQIAGALHFWGGGRAVWLVGEANWGGPIYAEQGVISLAIDSDNNQLGPVYAWSMHGGAVAAIDLAGSGNQLRQVIVPSASKAQLGSVCMGSSTSSMGLRSPSPTADRASPRMVSAAGGCGSPTSVSPAVALNQN